MVLLDGTRKVETREPGGSLEVRIPPLEAREKPVDASQPSGSVGTTLRAARESHGWDIDEIVRRTALSPRVLRALEADDFSASGGDCYARGHLRILARVLSLDENTLVEAVPLRDPLGEDETEPTTNGSDPGGASGSALSWPAVLGAVTLIAVLVAVLVLTLV